VSSKNNIYIYGGLGHNTSTSKDLIILSTSNTRSPVRNGRGGFRGRGGRGGGFGGGFGGGLLGDRQVNNENEERGAQNDFVLQRIKFSDEAPGKKCVSLELNIM